ncbi:MAG TPA: amidohydrolase family protein [Chloroflexota bacterium]
MNATRTSEAPGAWALLNAHLIDGDPGGYTGHGGVLISDGRIVASGPDIKLESIGDVPFLDVRHRSVLPGLIDCHAHLTWNAGASPVATFVSERESPVTLALRAAANARVALQRGTTTVRDLGGPDEVLFPLRDAIANGVTTGPRIVASGYVITTPTGHCHFMGRPASDPPSARDAALKQLAAGADVVKVMTSGGLHTPGTDPTSPQFASRALKEVVEVVHAAGRRVTGHATCDAAIASAVEAGFDSIQHGTSLEPATARALANAEVVLTPTLDTRYFLDRHIDDPAIPEVLRARARISAAGRPEAFRAALEAGVTVAAGTDSGTTFVPHGSLATEIRLLHEAGLPIRQALAAATWVAAREVGLPGRIGTLAPGAYADLVVLQANPLEDVSALEDVALVIASGIEVVGPFGPGFSRLAP